MEVLLKRYASINDTAIRWKWNQKKKNSHRCLKLTKFGTCIKKSLRKPTKVSYHNVEYRSFSHPDACQASGWQDSASTFWRCLVHPFSCTGFLGVLLFAEDTPDFSRVLSCLVAFDFAPVAYYFGIFILLSAGGSFLLSRFLIIWSEHSNTFSHSFL